MGHSVETTDIKYEEEKHGWNGEDKMGEEWEWIMRRERKGRGEVERDEERGLAGEGEKEQVRRGKEEGGERRGEGCVIKKLKKRFDVISCFLPLLCV